MAVSAARTAYETRGGWVPPALDIPLRRQPLTALVEVSAAPHRRFIRALAQVDLLVTDATCDLVDPTDAPRAVRLAAGIATIHAACVEGRTDAAEALAWFLGSERARLAELRSVSWDSPAGDGLVAMLPYVLDPFGLTTRRALIAGRASATERGLRKATGTFYTPGDVARHLADRVIGDGTHRVIDPACGAGVFLRAAFSRLCKGMPARLAINGLYGIDVEPAAVDACALVLVHDWLRREPLARGEAPVDRYLTVRQNLREADALELWADEAQPSLLGTGGDLDDALPREVDAVLMNPPFAPVGHASEAIINAFQTLSAATDPTRVNTMWPFWELATSLGGGRARVGAVLPLSVAYLKGPVARAGRRAVFSDADWEFSFFDRTPDALFGDDVKQRVALAVRHDSDQHVVRTGALRRWSADRREDALAPSGLVARTPDCDLILKIGTDAEGQAVDTLRRLGDTFGGSLSSARLVSASALDRSSAALAVAPTAYNWLGVYRDTSVAAEARAAAAAPVTELHLGNATLADAAYAIVVSHVLLWWWRATSDLFHVPLAWLRQAPFPLHRCPPDEVEQLKEAGRACWEDALDSPVVSTNRGVTLASYKPREDSLALARADDAVARAFGLGARFVRFARDDARRLRIAGRDA